MSQPEGEGGDIFGTMLAIDKDVMLAVTNGARLSIGDHNHRSMFSRHSAIRLDCIGPPAFLSVYNRLAADAGMWSSAVGNTHAENDFVGAGGISDHYCHGIKMVK